MPVPETSVGYKNPFCHLSSARKTYPAIEVVIDTALWPSEAFQFHPLVNTSTLVITRRDTEVFLAATGYRPLLISVPERKV